MEAKQARSNFWNSNKKKGKEMLHKALKGFFIQAHFKLKRVYICFDFLFFIFYVFLRAISFSLL